MVHPFADTLSKGFDYTCRAPPLPVGPQLSSKSIFSKDKLLAWFDSQGDSVNHSDTVTIQGDNLTQGQTSFESNLGMQVSISALSASFTGNMGVNSSASSTKKTSFASTYIYTTYRYFIAQQDATEWLDNDFKTTLEAVRDDDMALRVVEEYGTHFFAKANCGCAAMITSYAISENDCDTHKSSSKCKSEVKYAEFKCKREFDHEVSKDKTFERKKAEFFGGDVRTDALKEWQASQTCGNSVVICYKLKPLYDLLDDDKPAKKYIENVVKSKKYLVDKADKAHQLPRVLLLGASGLGKSSLIKKMNGFPPVKVGVDADGTTKCMKKHLCFVGDETIELCDSEGFLDVDSLARMATEVNEFVNSTPFNAVLFFVDATRPKLDWQATQYFQLLEAAFGKMDSQKAKQIFIVASKDDRIEECRREALDKELFKIAANLFVRPNTSDPLLSEVEMHTQICRVALPADENYRPLPNGNIQQLERVWRKLGVLPELRNCDEINSICKDFPGMGRTILEKIFRGKFQANSTYDPTKWGDKVFDDEKRRNSHFPDCRIFMEHPHNPDTEKKWNCQETSPPSGCKYLEDMKDAVAKHFPESVDPDGKFYHYSRERKEEKPPFGCDIYDKHWHVCMFCDQKFCEFEHIENHLSEGESWTSFVF